MRTLLLWQTSLRTLLYLATRLMNFSIPCTLLNNSTKPSNPFETFLYLAHLFTVAVIIKNLKFCTKLHKLYRAHWVLQKSENWHKCTWNNNAYFFFFIQFSFLTWKPLSISISRKNVLKFAHFCKPSAKFRKRIPPLNSIFQYLSNGVS